MRLLKILNQSICIQHSQPWQSGLQHWQVSEIFKNQVQKKQSPTGDTWELVFAHQSCEKKLYNSSVFLI